MRLDNFLTKALGVSRSEAVKIIKNKQIAVNEKIVIKKDTYIDEQKDIVKYNNQIIEYKEFIYIMLNKPKGYISLSSQILIFINKCLIVILPIV